MSLDRCLDYWLGKLCPHYGKVDERQKRRLMVLCVVLFGSLVIDAVFLLLPTTAGIRLLMAVMLATKPVLFLLLRTGYERIVTIAVPVAYLLSSSVGIYLSGGIRSPSSSVLIICIGLSGFLLGRRFLAVYTCAGIAVLVGMYYGEIHGLLPAQISESNFYTLASFIMTALIFAAAIDLLTKSVNHSLQSLEQSERSLAESNRILSSEMLERKQADDERRISEMRYRALFEGSRDALMVIEPPDWRYSSWNQAAYDMFGDYSRDEITELYPWSLSPAYQPDGVLSETKARRAIETMLKVGACFFEWQHCRRDGCVFPCQVLISRLEVERQVMVLATVRDVSEAKRVQSALQSSEEKYRSVIENIGDAYYRSNRDGDIQMVNPAAVRMFGYEAPEEMIGRSSRDFFMSGEERDFLLTLILQEGRVNDFEVSMKRRDGSQLDTSVTARLLRDDYGYYDGNEGIIRDISARKEAERALKESEERYRTLFEDSILGIFRSSLDGRYLQVNNAFARMFGYESPQQMISEVTDISSQIYYDGQERLSLLALLKENDYVRGFDVRMRHRDGGVLWISENVRVIRGSDGEVLRFEGTVEDISERVAAEHIQRETENRYRQVVNAAPWGMHFYELGGDGRMIFRGANTAADRILDVDHSALVGKTMEEISPTFAATPWAQAVRETANTGQPWTHEAVEYRTDRIHGIYQVHAFETEPGNIAITFQDVTAKKAAEDEIRFWNATLETRVRQRTAELEAANRELEAFAYSVSHDLRAPLRSIDGFSRALIEDFADSMHPHARHYLERVNEASGRMGLLIEDMLKLSRITRSEMRRVTVNCSLLAQHIAAEIQELQPERDVTWDIAPDVIVQADERLLEMALKNLLGNAWKYTAKCDRAHISFGGERDGQSTTLHVSDNGVGFDMAYQDKMFGAFQRLHSEKEFEGTGIGLAIVQRIVHRHGGRIWAEGKVGAGATFFFTIPEER